MNSPTVPSLYANGVVARGFRHQIPPLPCPPFCPRPPPCLTCPPDVYDVSTPLSFEFSADGGQTFTPVSMTVQTRLMARLIEVTSDTRHFEVEILSMNLQNVPPGSQIQFRESPTLKSTGKTTVQRPAGGGYRIGSFFDVFTELSLDGGQTWSPVINPTHLELQNSAGTP